MTPGIFPPTISTTPNSPIVWAKLSAEPVMRPGIESGSNDTEESAQAGCAESCRGGDQLPIHARKRRGKRLHGKGQAVEDRSNHQPAECKRKRVSGQRNPPSSQTDYAARARPERKIQAQLAGAQWAKRPWLRPEISIASSKKRSSRRSGSPRAAVRRTR